MATGKYFPASSDAEMPGTPHALGLFAANIFVPTYSFQELQDEYIAGTKVETGKTFAQHSGKAIGGLSGLMFSHTVSVSLSSIQRQESLPSSINRSRIRDGQDRRSM